MKTAFILHKNTDFFPNIFFFLGNEFLSVTTSVRYYSIKISHPNLTYKLSCHELIDPRPYLGTEYISIYMCSYVHICQPLFSCTYTYKTLNKAKADKSEVLVISRKSRRSLSSKVCSQGRGNFDFSKLKRDWRNSANLHMFHISHKQIFVVDFSWKWRPL